MYTFPICWKSIHLSTKHTSQEDKFFDWLFLTGGDVNGRWIFEFVLCRGGAVVFKKKYIFQFF